MSSPPSLRFAARTLQMRRSAVRELLKLTAQPEIISLAGGLPAPELFPHEALRDIAHRLLTDAPDKVLQYAETEGIRPLRELVAARFSTRQRGVGPEQVLITAGAQQALDLLARVFLEEGDRVVVENPTYLTLLSGWRPWGTRFEPADFNCLPETAPDLRQAPSELTQPEPPAVKCIYCVPNFQNPKGTTLPLGARCKLIEWAAAREAIVVEDDPYVELRFEGERLPSLFELAVESDPHGGFVRVLNIGSFSKTLAPGLRVGWVIADERIIDVMVRAKQAVDLHTNTLGQWLVLEAIRSGLFQEQLPRLRATYRERRDAMLKALQRQMPSNVTWTVPEGGMFLLVRLPSGTDAAALLPRALDRQVAFVPGEDFHLNGEGKNTLRLNFSNVNPDLIELGVERLAETIAEARTSPTMAA